ncbi:MAG: MFS transporter [Caulobacteraceae bacterium]
MRGFLTKVYAFKLFESLIPIFPFYLAFCVDRGLSPVQISIAITAWSLTAFVLEVPAGVLADRFSRKLVLLGGQAAYGACFLLWMLWPAFWGITAGLVLWGIKSALTNGVFEALVFDELKAEGREADYTRLMGRARGLGSVGMLGASLAAAALSPWGYPAMIAAGFISIAACTVALMALPTAPMARDAHDHDYFSHLKEGLALTWRTPVLAGTVAFLAALWALGNIMQEFWPVFGREVGLSLTLIAVIISGQYAVEAGVAALAHRLGGLPTWVFHVAMSVCGVILAAAAAIYTAPVMGLLVLYSWAMKAMDVVMEGRLQAEAPSHMRATIGSVKGFMAQIAILIFNASFGPLAQATSYRTAFLTVGVTAVAVGLVAWVLGFMGRRRSAGLV